jgi:ribonuclease E
MGVKVVLIPNIHLETPNYKIVRLRHDDVSEENVRASYELVELPSEIEEASAAPQKPEAVKQVAAVKGITLSAPAPIPAAATEAPKASLFSRFRNWLGKISSAKEEKEEEKPQPRKRESPRRGERGGRNEKRRGEGRAEKRETPRDATAKSQEPRQPREPRAEREKPQRAPAPAAAQQSAATETGEAKEVREPRSRRGRRGGSRERPPRNEAQQQLAIEDSVQAPAEPVTPANQIEPAELVEKAPLTSAQALPVVESVVEQPSDVEASEPTTVVAQGVEVSAAKPERKPRPPRRRKAEESTATATIVVPELAESGLVMIETKADAQVAPAPVVEAPKRKAQPAAWQKKNTEQAADEPLVMVETQQ